MEKTNIKKNENKLFKLNNAIIITSLITMLLGIADMTCDILHTKGDAIATAFLILGIVMSLPALAWLIMSIILLVKDKDNKIVDKKSRIWMIIVISISFITFIPLWIEGFIDGNGMPMFDRVLYRQIIWMIVWIVYLLTNLFIYIIAYRNRCKYKK